LLDSLQLKIAKWLFKAGTNSRKRLWSKLAALIRNGVPIKSALSTILERKTKAGKGKEPDAIALTSWITELNNGKSISGCIDGWVSDEEKMLISAGEKSGNVLRSLESIGRIMTAKSSIRKAVISGISYPIFVLLVLFLFIYLFGYKLFPAFMKMIPLEKFTGIAYIVGYGSLASQHLLLPVVILTIVFGVVFLYSLPKWNGRLRIKFDRYKPYSIFRIIQGSSWLIGFSALVQAGVRIEDAIIQMVRLANPWLKTRLRACLKELKSGRNLGEALLHSGYEFPDREIIDDLIIYSSLNGFEQSIETLGNEWIASSEEIIAGQMKVVGMVLLLLSIGTILIMVAGLMSMQLQIQNVMQAH